MVASATLNFTKKWDFVLVTPIWRIAIFKLNLMQIGLEAAEIDLFMYFQDGGHPPP